MNAPPDQIDVELRIVLRERWWRWAEIVRLFAWRKRTRYDIDPNYYLALHHELLALCRQAAHRAEYEELVTMLTPWVTLDALGWADPDVIHQLLRSAELVQKKLDEGVKKGWDWKELRHSAIGLRLSVVAMIVLIVCWICKQMRWNGGTLKQTLIDIGSFFEERGINQPILFGGIVITILVMLLVWLPGKRS
jgi:hypothetical protein